MSKASWIELTQLHAWWKWGDRPVEQVSAALSAMIKYASPRDAETMRDYAKEFGIPIHA